MAAKSLSTLHTWKLTAGAAVILVAAGLSASGCAPPPVIEMPGAPQSVVALVGEWDGSFHGRAIGDTGSIWFKLVEGEDHAHGDVLMKARDAAAPFMRYPPVNDRLETRPPAAATMLTIHFVRIDGDLVEGVLDPYFDPACDCEAFTTFTGRLFENRITGTFVTRSAGDAITTGAWEVTRRRPAIK
jgi:hypothetical protein